MLEADDSYAGLPLKVQRLFQQALGKYDFDHLFKCDDDTYLATDRLHELLAFDADLVGDTNLQYGWPSGGAGYLLSRRFVQRLAEMPSPGYGAEDLWVGQMALALGMKIAICDRLQASCQVFPRKDNDLITAHHCSTAVMEVIHRIYEGDGWPHDSIQRFRAAHNGWRGTLELLPNGVFLCGLENLHGRWEYQQNGEILFLNWFYRGLETLRRTERGYASSALVANQEPW